MEPTIAPVIGPDQMIGPAVPSEPPKNDEIHLSSGADYSLELEAPRLGTEKIYPSLYDTIPTSVAAIAIGIGIIGGIQWTVRRIFSTEKMEHKALTQFVTAMFALIVGVWIADKLIAGPSTELLLPEESTQLLTFIKDITLMVFSYYFGTKANVPIDYQDSSSYDLDKTE
jgi:hypothetical protein